MLAVEPRAPHMLTECTTTELHPQPLFSVVWRQDSSLGWPRTVPASLVQSTLPSLQLVLQRPLPHPHSSRLHWLNDRLNATVRVPYTYK